MSKDASVLPLKDCYSCIHNRVCKFIDTLNSTELPINLYESPCTEFTQDYTEDQMIGFEDIEEEESYGASLLLSIGNQLYDYEEEGKIVTEIFLTTQDKEAIDESVPDLLEVDYMMISGREIPVTISDELGTGQVFFVFES